MCLFKVNLIPGPECMFTLPYLLIYAAYFLLYLWSAGRSVQRLEGFCTSTWYCSASRRPAACMLSYFHTAFLLSFILIRCDKCTGILWFILWQSCPWLPQGSPCSECFTDCASIKSRHSTNFSCCLQYYCSTLELSAEIFDGHVSSCRIIAVLPIALKTFTDIFCNYFVFLFP